MAKTEIDPEEKKQKAAEALQKKLNSVLKSIIALKNQKPETRILVLEGITQPLPPKMLLEAVENGEITQQYHDWLKESVPHVFRTASANRAGGPREPREFPAWIDKIENAPAELIKRGKAFQTALLEFYSAQEQNLSYFAEEYAKDWQEYFRPIKDTDNK